MEQKNDHKKEELATKIASQSKRVKEIYKGIETAVVNLFRWFSGWVDRLLFNEKYSKLIAVILALILYMVMNFGSDGLLESSTRALPVANVPVTTNADEDVFEIIGLPETVDVTLFGDEADIQVAKNQSNYKVVADFTGKNDGEYKVDLTPQNFSSRVKVTVEPSSAVVTVRKKETGKFNISHEYMNENKMDSIYALGEPEFEVSEALVRASRETIDSIAYIKALIDVSDHQKDFSVEAPLVAYDTKGERMEVDIMPKIVNVKVPVSSPNKTLPITIVPKGEIPNNKAIESVTLDHATIRVYGNQKILDSMEDIKVTIDATKLDKETNKFYETISLPSGIRKGDINKVNIEIKLADKTSKVIDKIPIAYENNIHGLKPKPIDKEDAYATVKVTGAKEVIENISVDNIGKIYFDMKDIEPGKHELKLLIEPNNYLATYELDKSMIELEVIKP